MATAKPKPRAGRRKSSVKRLPANISYLGGSSDKVEKDDVISSMKPGPVVGNYTIADIKAKFHALDKNSDGILSMDELGALLRKGNPDMTDEELEALWKDINHDGDEGIDFDEFVDYLFGMYDKDYKDPAKQGQDWNGVSEVFHAIAHASGREHITYHEFLNLCQRLDILDDTGFDITKAMHLFKECKQSKRGLSYSSFQLLIKRVAKAKKVPLRIVVNWVASFTIGRANSDVVDTWSAVYKQGYQQG
mmetsp:Transcript_4602/g.10801  ORF Transcript_4602/g.10801 Transcript_4602/m.10801 type:complete len:248 (-) Transcript_4602:71-814(-)